MCERGYSRPLGLSESAGRMQPSEQPQARPEESANKTVVVLSLWVSGGLVCYITTANRAPPESLLELQNLKPPLQTYWIIICILTRFADDYMHIKAWEHWIVLFQQHNSADPRELAGEKPFINALSSAFLKQITWHPRLPCSWRGHVTQFLPVRCQPREGFPFGIESKLEGKPWLSGLPASSCLGQGQCLELEQVPCNHEATS